MQDVWARLGTSGLYLNAASVLHSYYIKGVSFSDHAES